MLSEAKKEILSNFSVGIRHGLPVYKYKNSCSYYNNMLITNISKESAYIEDHIHIDQFECARDLNNYPMIVYENYFIKNHCIYDISFEFIQEETYGEGPFDCGYCSFNMRRNNNIFNHYCARCFYNIEKRIIYRNTRKTL